MNYKINNIKKACTFRDTTFEELMEDLQIKHTKFICGNNFEEIYLEPWDKVRISRRLNTIVPYFYGIIDDKHLFKNKLNLEEYNKSKRAFKIEDYLVSIGMENYIYNIFDPLHENYLSKSYLNELLSNIYDCVFTTSLDEKYKCNYVTKNPHFFKEISNPSKEVASFAVSSCGEIIEFVENQTEEIAYMAVNQSGNALKYVSPEFHSVRVVKTAIKNSPTSFKYSKLLTYDICLEAVRADGNNLEFVPNEFRDNDLILAALNSNGCAIKFVHNQNKEFALTAVLQNTQSCIYIDEKIRKNNICIESIYNEVIKKQSL